MVDITTSTISWKSIDEPIEVTNIDVLAAMAETDPNENHGTKHWYVSYGGHDYPLKHIVGRAIAHATGTERREPHTNRGVKLVEELGFTTIKIED
ncbi:hypothetical protein [Natrinema salinisoli]|uniref:hypothetical protein n=1 Tax=Natrinema salinisoli TaxID=2878535 RepID=UPI001CF02A27|nr:hypothetical protein [Natrinema salinisoli]